MIAKRADILPFWYEKVAREGGYGANSLVFYYKDLESPAYAYRANNPYTETFKSPDENPENWSIDKTYAVPWKADGKYSLGSRVYYFNGARAYVYTPTVRYFGGNQPPNEELDEDGIRTWELEMDYGNDYNAPSEFLFPVRKFGGYTGSKFSSFDPLEPEDRPLEVVVIIDNGGSTETYRDEIVFYLQEKGIISKDYKEFNSVYQSFAYDISSYVFQEYSQQSNSWIHLNKGIHRAIYLKKLNVGNPWYTYAKSQYIHTLYAFSYQYGFSYWKKHGFSIEMWPNISDSDYELVPSSGLYFTLGFPYQSPYSPIPSYGVSIGPTNSSLFMANGVSFNGEIPKDGNGSQGTGATDPSYLKFDASFNRSNVAFNYRNCKFFMLKEDSLFDGYDVTVFSGVDSNGNPYTYYNYNQRPLVGPNYSIISEIVDSKEESYRDDNGYRAYQAITRSIEKGNPIDFAPYIREGTVTLITYAGWEID